MYEERKPSDMSSNRCRASGVVAVMRCTFAKAELDDKTYLENRRAEEAWHEKVLACLSTPSYIVIRQ